MDIQAWVGGFGFNSRSWQGMGRPAAAGDDENLEPKDTRSGCLVAADLEK